MLNEINNNVDRLLDFFKSDDNIKVSKIEYQQMRLDVYFGKSSELSSLIKIEERLKKFCSIHNTQIELFKHFLFPASNCDLEWNNANIIFHEKVTISEARKEKRICFDFCDFKKDFIISLLNEDFNYLRIQKCKIKNFRLNCRKINAIDFNHNISNGLNSIGIEKLTSSFNICRCSFFSRLRFTHLRIDEEAKILVSKCYFYQFIDISTEEQLHYFDSVVFRDNNWNFNNIKPKGFIQYLTGRVITNGAFNNSTYPEIHSLRRLSAYYREKKSLFEVIQFQRLINHSYLEKDLLMRDKFMLFSSRISNDFGTNYVRGIVFTLFSTLIFYLLCLLYLFGIGKIELSSNINDITQFISHFMDFLNLGKWKLNLFETGEYPLVNIFLYLGRIFIGFGVYQTIAAFRNLSKL